MTLGPFQIVIAMDQGIYQAFSNQLVKAVVGLPATGIRADNGIWQFVLQPSDGQIWNEDHRAFKVFDLFAPVTMNRGQKAGLLQ